LDDYIEYNAKLYSMKFEKNITLATILLLLSMAMAVFSLHTKGQAMPSVAIVVDGATGIIIKQPSTSDRDLFWNNYPILTMQAENQRIDPGTVIYDQNMQQHKLEDIIAKKNQLIFKYSIGFFDEEVDSTLRYIEQTHNQNIIVLTDADNARYFKLKSLMSKGLSGQMYYIEKPSLNLLLEKRNLPFLFNCSGNLRVSKKLSKNGILKLLCVEK